MIKMEIRETSLNKPIIEEKDRTKLPETVLCRVTYNICNVGELNANKRVYEKEVWNKVLSNDTLKEMLEHRRLFGQAEHPTETQSDLQLTSHVVHNMWIDEKENKVYQTIDVLDTPMGRIVDCLLRAGCGVGVSTRAEGDLEEAEDDKRGKFSRVIPESYKYITTDFTADPSTFGVLPIDVKRNVLPTIQAEMENKNATAGERKFAMQLFESLKVDEKSKQEVVKLDRAIKDRKVQIGSKVKYEKKDYKVLTLDETVGQISIGPEIQGREVRIEQDGVLIDGNPFVKVHEDGTVTIMPVSAAQEPKAPVEEVPPVGEEQVTEPEMEEKCGKDHKDKKKMKEGMDQLVARRDELQTKKESGKCTPEECEELVELDKKLSDMGVEESKIIEGFDVGDEVQIKDKKGNTTIVPKAKVAKKEEVQDGVMSVEITGSSNEDEQEWYSEDEYQIIPLSRKKWESTNSSIEEGFKTDLKNKDKKAIKQRMNSITDKLLKGETLSSSDNQYWKDYREAVAAAKNESTNSKIDKAITKAERDKALEVVEELSNEVEKIKNESSTDTLKVKMLMGKMKENTSAYDEVSALRTKLEEKAKQASEVQKELNEVKVKLEQTDKDRTEEITTISEVHKNNMNSIIQCNENRILAVKEDYEEVIKEYEDRLVESKEQGYKEGLKEGASKVLCDYVDRRLAELDLSIGENTRALLDECESIEDVEDILEKTKDIQRRNALHSEPITEIRIRNQTRDPEQVKVDKEVGNAFEGMH